MTKLALTVACWDYDRVRPLMDGRVQVEGMDLNILPTGPEETFYRAFKHAEFELSELSLSSTLMQMSRGTCAYTPIPVFPSRSFRHSCIYVRADGEIQKPSDMKGKRVAISEYQVTAAMVVRGILQDEYQVKPSDIRWVQAGLEQAGREDKVLWTPPEGVVIEKVADRSIVEMLDAGEIDALVTPRAPSNFDPSGTGPIRRMFPDHDRTEAEYYAKTGIFPVMHVLGIRNDVLDAHPWVAVSLVKAFTQAKDVALHDLNETAALKTSLPFLPAHVSQAVQMIGHDFWPYGLEANRRTLEAQLRWSFEQRLSTRHLSIEELFAPQSTSAFKI